MSSKAAVFPCPSDRHVSLRARYCVSADRRPLNPVHQPTDRGGSGPNHHHFLVSYYTVWLRILPCHAVPWCLFVPHRAMSLYAMVALCCGASLCWPLYDTPFPVQFRRQCMHFENSAGNFGGSAVRRPFGHDSAVEMSKLVALLPNSTEFHADCPKLAGTSCSVVWYRVVPSARCRVLYLSPLTPVLTVLYPPPVPPAVIVVLSESVGRRGRRTARWWWSGRYAERAGRSEAGAAASQGAATVRCTE